MTQRKPPYGWHSPTRGCYTKNCSEAKIKKIVDNPSDNTTKETTHNYTMITLECANCHKEFSKRLATHNQNVKRGVLNSFCSLSCNGQFKKKPQGTRTLYESTCQKCHKSFWRRKHTNVVNKYCSKECSDAAKINRTVASIPKVRKGEAKYCPKCSKNEIFNKETSCLECKFEARFGNTAKDDYSTVTLQNLRDRYSVQQYHAKVRGHSRSVFKMNRGEMKCSECGYDKHVDIAHIKDIKEFSMNTIVAEVNSMSNLVALCKNHHWEFDNPVISDKKHYSSLLTNRDTLILGELKTLFPQKFHDKLRTDSRSIYLNSKKPRVCLNCGYSKRIDVCHIKDVKDFSDNALISEVNSIDNLVALCPRDHWEFDHGILEL
jgi:hypothetical protein